MTLKEELLANVALAEDFEGFSGLPYECPAGFQTIGFGRNLEVYPYTRGEAIEWTSIKMAELRAKIMEECRWLIDHPPAVRIMLVDMAYNLGIRGLFNFVKMLRALEEGDFKEAAYELKNSKYFTQTGRRSQAHYDLLIKL